MDKAHVIVQMEPAEEDTLLYDRIEKVMAVFTNEDKAKAYIANLPPEDGYYYTIETTNLFLD